MKRIVPAMLLLISTGLSAHSLIDLHNRPELNVNSSFNELWSGNYGDALDLRINDHGSLSEEVTQSLIKKITDANDVLRQENIPYMGREAEIDNRLSHIEKELPRLDEEILVLLAERNQLYIRRTMTEPDEELLNLIDTNRRNIYDSERNVVELTVERGRLKREIKSVRRFLTVNNLFIRRNILRINSLGGFVAREPVEKEPVILSLTPVPQDPPPLVHPETLPRFSMAAMDGFELDRCPLHDHKLEYTEKMVAETYRGIKYSYPLYAGWCNVGDTAYIYREQDDESKKVVIEIRDSKKARIDEMLKKS